MPRRSRKQRLATQHALETRWLYHAEATALRYNSFANDERSIEFLRKLAERIWKNEASPKRKMPEIWATNGMRWHNAYTSFCLGTSYIELARHHRTVKVLIHELTHALGVTYHGERFVRLYFKLLNKYAGYNKWFLQSLAAERGIMILK